MTSFFGPMSAFMSSVTWAMGSVVYSEAARKYPAYIINLQRSVFALPLFLLLVMANAGPLNFFGEFAFSTEIIFWVFVSMVASYGFGDFLFFWSTRSLGVPTALAIASCYPMWSALSSYFFFGETFSYSKIGGLLLVMSGVSAVILSDKSSNTTSEAKPLPGLSQTKKSEMLDKFSVGLFLSIGVSLFWALNTFAISKIDRAASPFAVSALRMAFAIPACWMYKAILKPEISSFISKGDIRKTGWVYAVEACGGSLFFLYGLTHSSLAVGAALTSLAPVISVPIAYFVRKERVSTLKLAGILMTVIGAYFLVVE